MYELITDINRQIQAKVNDMTVVKADALGLDIRAGYKIYVGDTCIAVNKRNDRDLQYYGGFEYCDKDCRIELGDYVVYFADDDRVQECLALLAETVDLE
jgi:hypothetical protein